MFVFDTSGSMEPVLEEAKGEIQNVMTQLGGVLPNVDFGLAEARDYGGSAYDPESDDEPWKLDVPVTSNLSAMTDAISGLHAEGGGDASEAYGRALWETDTNPNVGWRPGARHLIILIADQVPHNTNLDEGIPEEFWAEPSPWNTGEELPGGWGIPGTQLKEGEKLDFHSVLRQLAADGKPLETVDYHDTSVNYIHYWEYWAALAGGTAVETSEGGQEFAGKLVGLIENAPEDTVCATTAVPSEPSPNPPSALPTALTPRFGQPGSIVALTPASGKEFCAGQQPYLGGNAVTAFEEFTPSKITFRVPPTAEGGLALSNLFGVQGTQQAYAVDNFRYPWGFPIENRASDGSGGTYDAHISVQPQDLESVFKEIGSPGNEVYEFVKSEAEKELHSGLCYGFSLLSRSLYDDAHGGRDSLSYANSTGFTLAPGAEAYTLTESNGGTHALTHALLRAAVSQQSPEARLSWHNVASPTSAETELNAAFRRGQPAILIIKYNHEGHALLAFNYQKTPNGLAIDVVDPNLPWSASRPASDYENMQVNISPSGTWTYNGTFVVGMPFASPVTGPPGSLYIAPEPRSPGGLTLWYNSAAPADTAVTLAGGTVGVSISYSSKPGHGIPGDVREGEDIDDAVDNRLLIPPSRRLITITQANASPQEKTYVTGHNFLDVARTAHGVVQETVETHTGTISVPRAKNGDMLSVTHLAHGVQETATATFHGNIVKPTIDVSSSGQVTLTTGGGTGKVMIGLATYTPGGQRTLTRPQTIKLHGRTRLDRHTPKIKRRKHKRSKRRPRRKK
jgi:hypothetical protein